MIGMIFSEMIEVRRSSSVHHQVVIEVTIELILIIRVREVAEMWLVVIVIDIIFFIFRMTGITIWVTASAGSIASSRRGVITGTTTHDG